MYAQTRAELEVAIFGLKPFLNDVAPYPKVAGRIFLFCFFLCGYICERHRFVHSAALAWNQLLPERGIELLKSRA